MMTLKPAKLKALALLSILATTGGTLATSVQATPDQYVNGHPQTGCELPVGTPCSPIPLYGNQGTTVTPSARCIYNDAGQLTKEVVTATFVSAGPGHCCTSLSNSYETPACLAGVPSV